MGRKKIDEMERLEAQVRELKAVNRSLLKRLKKINKGYHKERETKKPRREEPEPKETAKRICPDCSKGEVVEMIVLNRRFETCTQCDRRTQAKIIPTNES